MKSESIKELTTALSKAQIAFKPIKRTEKVDYQTTGGRKKYNYAPLSEVIDATKKALADNGLAITQSTKLVEGNTILETLLSHSSGEWLSSELYVGKQDQPPQSEGSSLTYKRRYGMSAMLCIASEDDDDAEGAMEHPAVTIKSKAEVKSVAPPSVADTKTAVTKHYCQVHKTAFFMRGQMKSYGHPVKDAKGQQMKDDDGKDIWCHEHKEEQASVVLAEDTEGLYGDEPPREKATSKEPSAPAWSEVKPMLVQMINNKVEGWEKESILKTLVGLGATGATGARQIEDTYNSLAPERKLQFYDLVEKAFQNLDKKEV